ncbi:MULTISPECIES: DUF485 domain-containing protein [unclassified Streptomyces]|uniref:DUF485 domain-containing protein n=1 Tax=unclassified Streptomyces TaxID=2593676 RepID=UPI001655C558|nr:DUF485 domain-containing protein [Streptomyces sp. CB02980]MCB8901317.1 DUF485 domain-containing protein [Streptomyces sp. CB02980]
MSYHQPFPGPPPVPQHRNAGRHRQEAASQSWEGGSPSWDTDPQAAWDSSPPAWDSSPQGWDSAQQPWDASPQPQPPAATDDRDDLHRLGSAYRRLRRVATFTALGYFVIFLFLSGYAPSMMTGNITGGLTTGLVLGLLQLPVALAAIALYERIARNRVDPLAAAIRERAEQAAAAAAPRPERPRRSGRPVWQQPTGGARA